MERLGKFRLTENKEILLRQSYREVVKKELGHLPIWDYLKYDKEGDLYINDIKVKDIARSFGTPLEIVDTRIVKSRARQWINLTKELSSNVGYTGGIEYFYASKANPASEVVSSAIGAGWNIETSSQLDLENILWLKEKGLFPKETKIICNGLKLHPAVYNRPSPTPNLPKHIAFEENTDKKTRVYENSYAEMITLLKDRDFNISPIIDSIDELDYFAQPNEIPAMDVGVRLKVYGAVKDDKGLDTLVSRHGMNWEVLKKAADRIKKVEHLNLTMFHAMVGAAETIPVNTLIESIMVTMDKYFELKKTHPSLKYFNMGGGIPPLSSGWNHKEFLTKLFTGISQKAKEYNLPEPVFVFELGSYLASESGHHVMKALLKKNNNVEPDGTVVPWYVVDLTFMRAIPDMLMIDKNDFVIIAANNANRQASFARLGDLTCDSDGRWPTKEMEPRHLLVPYLGKNANGTPSDADGTFPILDDTYFVIVASGAYGETLTGVGGVGHCGILEPGEFIVWDNSGRTHARFNQRQSVDDASGLLGYKEENLSSLRKLTQKA